MFIQRNWARSVLGNNKKKAYTGVERDTEAQYLYSFLYSQVCK